MGINAFGYFIPVEVFFGIIRRTGGPAKKQEKQQWIQHWIDAKVWPVSDDAIGEIEAILGRTAALTGQKDSTVTGYYLRYSHTYTGTLFDKKSGKPSKFHYTYEQFSDDAAADKTIDVFIASNKNHVGYQSLTTIGDEGFFQTDHENFCVFVARKGKILIKLKVNKLTSKTDLEGLKRIGTALVVRI